MRAPQLGVITQSTGAFNNVLNDLSIIINQFESLSAFSAGLGRLATFVERMESYQSGEGVRDTTYIAHAQRAAPPADLLTAWHHPRTASHHTGPSLLTSGRSVA